ncbi:MAG: type I-E CRISPR-associated endoribonuclease Cas2e [Candidatus Nanopelagicales bacterium]
MTVVVLTAVPAGLRGVLTRWLLEIAPGVFVGHVSTRVRAHIWQRIVDGVGRGRALMVYSKRNEQGLEFLVHGHNWEPIDYEGISLMCRPLSKRPSEDRAEDPQEAPSSPPGASRPPPQWSYAERRLMGRNPRK